MNGRPPAAMTEIEPYTAPARVIQHATAVDSWVPIVSDVLRLASHVADTEFVPKNIRNKPAAVAAAMLSGREIGLQPMESLAHVRIIEGTPALSAQKMRAMVLAAGHHMRYPERTNTRCRVAGRRASEQEWTEVTWTLDDAKAAGISGKDNWRKWPRRMLTARATSELCQLLFPDVLGGMTYTIEELEDGGAPSLDVPAPVIPSPDADRAGEGRRRTAQRRTAVSAGSPALTPAAPAVSAGDPAPTTTLPPLPGEPGYDSPAKPTVEMAGPAMVSKPQLDRLHATFSDLKMGDRADRLTAAAAIINRPVASSTELTAEDAAVVIDTLSRMAALDDGPLLLAHLVTEERERTAVAETAPGVADGT